MKKRWLRLLSCLLLVGLLSGCTRGLQSKTVIIPDQEEQSEAAEGNGAFAVSKIYKLLENEADNEDILGWIDNEYVLTFNRQDGERTIGRLDYQYQTSQSLFPINNDAIISALAPDGQTISMLKQEDGKVTVQLFNVKDGKETTAAVIPGTSSISGSLQWSGNSRYLSFVTVDFTSKTAEIVVFDTVTQTENNYPIADWNRSMRINDVKISDNGKYALFVKEQGKQSVIVLGSLNGQVFKQQYEHETTRSAPFDYVNDDQFLYVGKGGALTLFDHRTETSVNIVEQVDAFGLSNNRKGIVYSKASDSIYAATLQGNRVLNEKAIYKGMIAARLIWSPDGKKILISGRKSYESSPRAATGPVPGLIASEQTASSQKPLVIELK